MQLSTYNKKFLTFVTETTRGGSSIQYLRSWQIINTSVQGLEVSGFFFSHLSKQGLVSYQNIEKVIENYCLLF